MHTHEAKNWTLSNEVSFKEFCRDNINLIVAQSGKIKELKKDERTKCTFWKYSMRSIVAEAMFMRIFIGEIRQILLNLDMTVEIKSDGSRFCQWSSFLAFTSACAPRILSESLSRRLVPWKTNTAYDWLYQCSNFSFSRWSISWEAELMSRYILTDPTRNPSLQDIKNTFHSPNTSN